MNKLLKGLVFDNQISLAVLDTTEMVNEAIKIHNFSPVCSAAFGRSITACTFMSSGLKNERDKLSVVINGGGPCGKITVCGNAKLEMRGYMDNPMVNLPLKPNGKLDVGGCVGKEGKITVIKSMGLKEPYSGTSKLINGEIAEDFTAYYAYSEQQPTAMALGVKIGTDGKCIGSGGVIIQALPFAEEKNLIRSEEIINELTNISTQITELGAEGIVEKYFGKVKCESYKPEYKCLCNRNTIEGVIVSLGKAEAEKIVKEDGKIQIDCEFCNKKYIFNEEDVKKLF